MTRIVWGDTGSRTYQNGVDRGVLYIDDLGGVPWNGLISVAENPTGGAASPFYVDGEKYLNEHTREEFEATITAYTYPDAFEACDGTATVRSGLLITQQKRKSFGLTYRSLVGNDTGPDAGYKIHLVYNALAAPSPWTHKSTDASSVIDSFVWKLTTLPMAMPGYARAAHLVLDSRDLDPLVLSGLEDILYGNDTITSRLPGFAEVVDMIDTGNTLVVVDHGDGTYSVTAPMSSLTSIDANTFQVDWSTVTSIDANTFTISSP